MEHRSIIPLLGVVHLGQPQGAAVRGLSFSVGTGEVVILLGLNGAGKSTTLKAISAW